MGMFEQTNRAAELAAASTETGRDVAWGGMRSPDFGSGRPRRGTLSIVLAAVGLVIAAAVVLFVLQAVLISDPLADAYETVNCGSNYEGRFDPDKVADFDNDQHHEVRIKVLDADGKLLGEKTQTSQSFFTPVQIFIPLLEGEPASCDVQIDPIDR